MFMLMWQFISILELKERVMRPHKRANFGRKFSRKLELGADKFSPSAIHRTSRNIYRNIFGHGPRQL